MRSILAAGLLASTLLSCASNESAPPNDNDDDYEIVADGKEDSYRSPTTLEFSAKADATVVLPETARSRSVSA